MKLELGQPDVNTPGNGKIVVEVDVSSTASPTFKGRGGDDIAAELSAALRSLLQGSTQQKYCALDLTTLSIVHGKTCWIMYIDAVVLSVGGNLLDVLSLAMKAALADTEIPKVEVSGMEDDDDIPEIEIDSEETWKLDSSSIPTTITVCQVERSLLVDPTADEEVCADSALAVGVASTGDVVGITKLGFCSIPHDICKDMIHLAQETGKRLLRQLRLTL